MGNSTEKKKEQLLAAVNEEAARWGDRVFVVDIDLTCCLAMIGAMQLALRHPDFQRRATAKQVRDLIFRFIEQVPEDYPALRELMRLGFHQRFESFQDPS